MKTKQGILSFSYLVRMPQTIISISEKKMIVDLLYLPAVFSLSSHSETALKLVKLVYI